MKSQRIPSSREKRVARNKRFARTMRQRRILQSGITDAAVAAAQEETDYLTYRDARDAGESTAAIVAYWGSVRSSTLEARYQVELAERHSRAAMEELQGNLSPAERMHQ